MAHWYKFQVGDAFLICRASRKVEVERYLNPYPAVKYCQCVADDKIEDLRKDPAYVILKSVSFLIPLLKYLPGGCGELATAESGVTT